MRHSYGDAIRVITLEGKQIARTARAILIKCEDVDGNDKQVWIPLSQVSSISELRDDNELSISIPLWLAEKNNLA